MDKQKKPRLAEVLGVEVGERFIVPGYCEAFYIDEFGVIMNCVEEMQLEDLAECINHPDRIIRVPRLTEAELAICKAVWAKWVSRGALGAKNVVLWDAEPERFDDGTFGSTDTAHRLARMYTGFENIRPGDCICVEEAESNA